MIDDGEPNPWIFLNIYHSRQVYLSKNVILGNHSPKGNRLNYVNEWLVIGTDDDG